ncbi:hypothetical protein WH47_08435 [Habropoda laboriosa]|uniref:Uncharacterized protein n=1 Tax=Habropoda laboriosa TaxID=597456 RepID=A0A0L7RFN2_9HYME|nr:hypothetical protein WH47_08435 [Habropoda laboriosa]
MAVAVRLELKNVVSIVAIVFIVTVVAIVIDVAGVVTIGVVSIVPMAVAVRLELKKTVSIVAIVFIVTVVVIVIDVAAVVTVGVVSIVPMAVAVRFELKKVVSILAIVFIVTVVVMDIDIIHAVTVNYLYAALLEGMDAVECAWGREISEEDSENRGTGKSHLGVSLECRKGRVAPTATFKANCWVRHRKQTNQIEQSPGSLNIPILFMSPANSNSEIGILLRQKSRVTKFLGTLSTDRKSNRQDFQADTGIKGGTRSDEETKFARASTARRLKFVPETGLGNSDTPTPDKGDQRVARIKANEEIEFLGNP